MIFSNIIRYGYPLIVGRRLNSCSRYKPFFIIGSGRSGNTLLRAILEAHPDIHIPPETYVLGRIIKKYKFYSRMPWNDLLKVILAEFDYSPEFHTFDTELRSLYAELKDTSPEYQNLAYVLHKFYMHHATVIKPTASRWGDKTPQNIFSLHKIRSVFPDAKFVHIIRDGRDVVRSYIEMGYYKNINDAAGRWVSSIEKAKRFGKKFPRQYHEVKYEELVRAPEWEIRSLCSFLGLEFASGMLRHNELSLVLGDVDIYSHLGNVKNPINGMSVGKWRQYFKTEEISELESMIGCVLENLGYEL